MRHREQGYNCFPSTPLLSPSSTWRATTCSALEAATTVPQLIIAIAIAVWMCGGECLKSYIHDTQPILIGTHSYLLIPLPNNITISQHRLSSALKYLIRALCVCVTDGSDWFASVRDAHSIRESGLFFVSVYNVYVCLKSNNSLCSARCVHVCVAQRTCSCCFSNLYHIGITYTFFVVSSR